MAGVSVRADATATLVGNRVTDGRSSQRMELSACQHLGVQNTQLLRTYTAVNPTAQKLLADSSSVIALRCAAFIC